MNNTRLPNIGGSLNGSASSPQFSSRDVPFANDKISAFERSAAKLSELNYPTVNAVASVKNRIQTLEEIADIQSTHNKTAHDSFINLSGDLSTTELNLKDLMQQMQSGFDLKLAALKKEYDHRFELQSSENKRLQNHVSSLKSDTHQLKRKLQSTADKLKKLQQEFGDPDELLEEEPSLSLSTQDFNLGASLGATSRPNTTSY